jgi:hypothetical protein
LRKSFPLSFSAGFSNSPACAHCRRLAAGTPPTLAATKKVKQIYLFGKLNQTPASIIQAPENEHPTLDKKQYAII